MNKYVLEVEIHYQGRFDVVVLKSFINECAIFNQKVFDS